MSVNCLQDWLLIETKSFLSSTILQWVEHTIGHRHDSNQGAVCVLERTVFDDHYF